MFVFLFFLFFIPPQLEGAESGGETRPAAKAATRRMILPGAQEPATSVPRGGHRADSPSGRSRSDYGPQHDAEEGDGSTLRYDSAHEDGNGPPGLDRMLPDVRTQYKETISIIDKELGNSIDSETNALIRKHTIKLGHDRLVAGYERVHQENLFRSPSAVEASLTI